MRLGEHGPHLKMSTKYSEHKIEVALSSGCDICGREEEPVVGSLSIRIQAAASVHSSRLQAQPFMTGAESAG